jgi:hypothetical protein
MTFGLISHSRSTIKKLPLLILFSLLLSGCAGLIRTEQPSVVDWAMLSTGNTVGQTFVAKYDGLAGIYFYLSPQAAGNGQIQLHLRSQPQAEKDLAVSVNTLSIDTIRTPGFYGFLIPSQASSNQKYYYAFLEVSGSGQIQVGKATGDTYLNGAFYQNGKPEDAQAAFQLLYSRRKAIWGLSLEAISWGGILITGFFLFFLPGWGLFSLLWPGWGGLKWPEKLGLSAGLSLAFYPLFLLWTDTICLHLGAIYAWLPPLIGLGIIIWRNRKRLSFRTFIRFTTRPSLRENVLQFPWADVVYIGIVVLIILTRFWAIRSLEAPLWADSVQHTVITQLLLDNGGLFKSWLPYAPYNSFTSQFGFPTFAALFSWLTGMSSVKATLIIGQIINVLAVVVLYPLAVRIAKGNRWAGIGALLVAGLLMTMPAYYVNWGRYAQLAGQAVLPVALWLVWEALAPSTSHSLDQKKSETGKWIVIGLSALTLAGMMLSSYRLPFFYPTFILALLVCWGLPEWGRNWKTWVRKIGILMAVAVLAVLLFLPWLPRLLGSNLVKSIEIIAARGSSIDAVRADYQAWFGLFWYVPLPLVVVTIVGLGWSLIRKNWMVAAQILWVALLASVVAGGLIHLPASSSMRNFAILIALYIPIGLVVGWLISEVAGSENGRLRQSLLAITIFIAAILGALGQRNIAKPDTFAYVSRPDILAMAWIREHLPEDAHFLVEGLIYQNTGIIGSDAGWWLPLLAGSQNSMPPQYATAEVPIEPGYTQRLVALVNKLKNISPGSAQGVSLLCSEGITHVYIGQGQGKVALRAMNLGPQLFSPGEFLSSKYYSLLYHQDRVYVFGLNSSICP